MAIRIVCACGKLIRAPESAIGHQGRCPRCGAKHMVPAPELLVAIGDRATTSAASVSSASSSDGSGEILEDSIHLPAADVSSEVAPSSSRHADENDGRLEADAAPTSACPATPKSKVGNSLGILHPFRFLAGRRRKRRGAEEECPMCGFNLREAEHSAFCPGCGADRVHDARQRRSNRQAGNLDRQIAMVFLGGQLPGKARAE
jgi:hypothetical protein